MMSTYPESSQHDLSDPLPPPTHVRHGHKRRATLEYPKLVFLSSYAKRGHSALV